jgi:UDP-3-O-[3-hydroxymyristoyl] glucosamine N-acyltransferase
MASLPSLLSFTAGQIAERLQGEVLGDSSVQLTGFAAADSAKEGDLTFAEKEAYFSAAEKSPATAILVSGTFASPHKVLIRVPNTRVAVARILPLFFPPETRPPGVHSSAVVDPSAQIDATVHVGPHCVIEADVKLGAGSVLMGGNQIGHDSQIARNVRLHPNVVIYPDSQIGNRVIIHAGSVIGSDGYGYVFDEGVHRKILQIGNVVIHDDVEIGANVTIDRGALGSTVIGQGTKIDNLVHVAHNVVIGPNCIVMGQSGFAGSTELGAYCVIASQSGIAGHLKLGNQAMVGAKSGVMRDVPDKGRVVGSPAYPDIQSKRQWIALEKLPDLLRRVRALEEQLSQMNSAQ